MKKIINILTHNFWKIMLILSIFIFATILIVNINISGEGYIPMTFPIFYLLSKTE